MWKKKIKNKKLQYALIAIILSLASCILTVSISFSGEVSSYINDYYSKKSIKDIVFTSYDKETSSKVEKFVEENESNEKNIKKSNSIGVDRKVYLNESNLNMEMTSLVLYEGEKNHPWEVIITTGEKSLYPNEGEIWISNVLADSKNLKVGDKLKVKSGENSTEFTISSLVNDSMVPNSTMGNNNLFIGKKDYDKIDYLDKFDIIAYNASESTSKSIEKLNSYLGYPINGSFMDKETVVFSAKATAEIISGVGISIAILVFILSIIIIRFILWNNILKEFRDIGIHKALGFSSSQISLIYIKSFGIVGVVSILIGAILSFIFKGYLVEISLKYIGELNIKNLNIVPLIIVSLTLGIILILNLFFMLRKLKKIVPVEALVVGVTSSKAKFKKSFIKNASKPISMAVNDIFKYKKQSLIISIVLIFTMYLSVFVVGVNHSIENMRYNTWNVFGSAKGDMNIGFSEGDKEYENALAEVKKDKRIGSVLENEFDLNSISVDSNKYNIQNMNIFTLFHSSYEGMNIEVGKNPENTKEIAVSNKILNDSKLEVGDYIEVDILGEKKKLLITGSYKTLISSGYSMRGLSSLLDNSKNPKNIIIKLKNKEDYKKIENYYKNKYKTSSVDDVQSIIKTTSDSIVDIISPIVKILLVSVVLFSIINIVNILVINNNDNRRNHAVLKSLGFSNNYILRRTLFRIIILSVIAVVGSILLNIFVSPILFKIALMGINAFMFSITKTLLTLIFILVLIVVGTILVMSSIRKIKIIELLED